MKRRVITTVLVAASVGVLVFLVFPTGERHAADAASAEQAALTWTGAEFADTPRRDGDDWEVDVRRLDGSLVEVTLGRRLELRELDEELSAGGLPAHDEVLGVRREEAITAARPKSGPGPVRGVERERDGSIEVDVLRPGNTVVEVELDHHLHVTDVDREEIGDE